MKKLFLILALLLVTCNSFAGTITFGAVAGNWSDATKWVGGVKPVAGDDVLFVLASADCVVDEATANLKSFDMSTYTGVLSGSFAIHVDGAAGATNVCLFAGSPTWTGTLNLDPPATAVINLTFGSLTTAGTCGNITIAGATTGRVIMLDGVTQNNTKTVTLTSGTLKTDGATDNAGLTHYWGSFQGADGTTRTLTLGNSNFFIFNDWTHQNTTYLTLTAHTADFTFTGNNCMFRINSTVGNYSNSAITFNCTGYGEIVGGGSIGTLTRNGTTTIGDQLWLYSNVTIVNALNINGYSSSKRMFVFSYDFLNNQRTFTTVGATVSCNNADFRDIGFHNHASLDLTNGGANVIGDCGGNSIDVGTLIFTTPESQNFNNAAGGYWSGANWTGANGNNRMPLPQDPWTMNTVFNSGVSIYMDVSRVGGSGSFAGATASGAGVLPTLVLNNSVTNYGSLNLTNISAFSGIFSWRLESWIRSGINYLTLPNINFNCVFYVQTVGATLQLASAIRTSSNFIVYYGNFIDAGFNFQAQDFTLNNSASANPTATKTGNWILSRSATGNLLSISTTGVTWSDTAGTITLSNTSASVNKTFAGGGKTFNNLSIAGGGTGAIIFTGANTFTGTVTVNAPKTITLPSATTTNVGNFVAVGTLGDVITLNASTPGSAATLNKTGGGTIQCRFLNITDVNVTPANTWFYGNYSTLISGTGWGIIAASLLWFL